MKKFLNSFTMLGGLQVQPTIAFQEAAGSSYFSNSGAGLNSRATTNSFFSPKKINRFFKNSPFIPLLFIVIVVMVIGFFALKQIAGQARPQAVATTQQTQLPTPLAQETLNKSFTFPLKDANGKVISQIQFVIQTAEVDSQIIIKGERATAVKGREFLILNLKITNNYSKSINLNTRDYLRLSANGSNEKLAPDIHNDPVEVQAISTKYTRVGFAINTSDQNLILQVGEINGTKQEIKLNLK